MTAFPNKFAGTCRRCNETVPVGAGICEKIDGKWNVTCAIACEPKASAPRKQAAVGDLAAILALFAKARTHLKFPAIVIGVPALGPDNFIRINVAGDRAKVPGSLTVVDAERNGEGQRDWFGRIMLDGIFQPSAKGSDPAIAARLREFASDPARIAGEDGRLHGRCCFCRIALSDERSTAVGYGKKCSQNFGLPWGTKPAEFAAAAIEREMQMMEAECDRLQTLRDERAKREARMMMEDAR